MRTLLGKYKIFTIALVLLTFCGNANAQTYTITGVVNANALTCSSFIGNNIISIGNGTVTTPASKLVMDADLDLTTCGLGSIQIIVNNATIDFSTSNKRLYLPEGSSISFINGGTLNPAGGTGGGCTGNDRIYIGGVLLATCQGGPGLLGFDEIISFGGSGSTSSNSPVCVGNSISLTATPPPNGGSFTYIWYEPSVSSTTSIGTGQSISIASATSGTHIYQVRMFSASLNKTMIANATVLVNTGASTAAPTVTITQPTCTLSTGTITVTAPTSAKYSINGLTYTNTSGVFTSLAPGTYSVTAKNSSGCISPATIVTIKNATNTWNGSSWSNVTTPIITENIVFDGFYSSTSSIDACSCTVNSGVSVNINAGHTLNLTNGLNVASLGTMTFLNGASLLQSNTAPNINSGDIDYQRSTFARKTDYTYWSSPVFPMTLGELYPLGGTFYSYEATSIGEDWKQETAGTNMVVGKGYIANRGAEIPTVGLPPTLSLDVAFTGVPNNGTIPITGILADKSYLLGNPYPSAIDADIFLNDNAGVLEGTLYFWTHNTAMDLTGNVINPGPGWAYTYSLNDYAAYNPTGGVGINDVPFGPGGSAAPTGGAKPNGKIAAGQGFFASSKAVGTVNFTNLMRLAGTTLPDGTGVNQQFFKSRNPITKTVIEKNRVWLNLTNTQGAFKQMLVGYITGATNDYDDRFDGESYDGNEFVDFYSVNQDKNLVIQGRALPFDENDEVPLGYRTTINGDFTINIDQVDGLLTNKAVFIEDKLTHTITDLKSGNYTFNTVAGTFNDRFVLRYTNANKLLGTTNFDSLEKTVLVSNKNKQIKINSSVEMINKVTIFDLLGRQIYQKEKVNSNELLISNLVSSRQVVIVKTELQNGETVTDKIMY